MKLPRRQFLHLAAGAAGLLVLPRIASAQSYPSRPSTVVVPFPAGGALDVFGRILAERMKASLGQTIIVENVAGANGSLGVGRVARAAPDGYTVVIGYWGTHVANGAVYALPYDVLSDFEPISLTVTQPFLIAAKRAIPTDDLKGLIAWLKVSPGKASAGISGIGAMDHVGAALFQTVTGTHFQFVPYRGAAPAIQDLVAGQIDLMFGNPINGLPQVRGGQIKAFAVTAKSRLAAAPQIPTVDEAGLPGFYVSFWLGLWAPKGTPKDVIAKLNSAAVTALADPTVRMRLAELGFEIFPATDRRPKPLLPTRKLKSRNGGQSSRRPESKQSEPTDALKRAHHEISSSTISASGSGCCRSHGRVEHRTGADLSGATGALDRTLPAGRRRRHSCAPDGATVVGTARPTIYHRQPPRCRRQYWH
jgi:tripartite-type tricarboxylate transporter receptor subunit TctC